MSDGAGGGPLLVVVDAQRVFAEPGSPWHTPGFAGIVEPIERLRAAFGGRELFTRFLVPAAPRGSWAAYYRRWSFASEPAAAPLLELSRPWAAARPPTLDRTTFSKWGPELAAARSLVLCGAATDCCVIATALAAADAGAFVRVVADACVGASPEAHARALALMAAFSPQVEVSCVALELDRGGAGPPGGAR